ncbi:MAG TPA: transporter [Actinomycetota bacterium]|nr:transporter [Actinomycetota bacterium]
MIWVSWRQHRTQLLAGAAAAAIATFALYLTGMGIWSNFRGSGLAHCLTLPSTDCSDVASLFSERYTNLSFLVPLFLAVPALIGIFWGAPLVAREFEQGTQRLAWTQGVTRVRWAGTKVAVLGAATVAITSILTYALTWWSRPLVTAGDARFQLGIFDLRGIVPVAYATFALAVGVFAGVLIRRTVPAMVASILAYAAVRAAVEFWLRPHFARPLTIAYPIFAASPRARLGDWVVSQVTLDGSGHVLSHGASFDLAMVGSRCPGVIPKDGSLPDKRALQACIERIGLRVQDTYQPGTRFMTFQVIEFTIFLALAAALIAASLYVLRRRSG